MACFCKFLCQPFYISCSIEEDPGSSFSSSSFSFPFSTVALNTDRCYVFPTGLVVPDTQSLHYHEFDFFSDPQNTLLLTCLRVMWRHDECIITFEEEYGS